MSYLQNYKEFKAKILDLQPEKYGLSFDIKKCTTSGWALGDENVIGIRAFKNQDQKIFFKCLLNLPLLPAILYSELILILIKFLYAWNWKDGEFWNFWY